MLSEIEVKASSVLDGRKGRGDDVTKTSYNLGRWMLEKTMENMITEPRKSRTVF
jgi:hypothetical protein